jgi:hypothetical protein
MDELRYELREKDIDVLGIAESWTHADVMDAEVAIEGYELFRRDREKRKRRRCIVVHKVSYCSK